MSKQPIKSNTCAESDQVHAGHFVGHIRTGENDHLVARLLEVIGDESLLSFSRRCGVGEGTLRNVIKNHASPRTDHLIAIADTANVTIDWLATGRQPKSHYEQGKTPAGASICQMDEGERLVCAIEAVETGMATTMPPRQKAELIAAAYALLATNTPAVRAQVAQLIKLASAPR